MREVKIMVSGSRSWLDEEKIERTLSGWAREMRHSYGPLGFVLIHGGARGADRTAGRVAHVMGWRSVCYPADWERYGLSAGPIRNNQMLEQHPDRVFIFWDGRSRGTKQVLDAVRDRRIPFTLVMADGAV